MIGHGMSIPASEEASSGLAARGGNFAGPRGHVRSGSPGRRRGRHGAPRPGSRAGPRSPARHPPTRPITATPPSASAGPRRRTHGPAPRRTGSSPSGSVDGRAEPAGDAALGQRDRDPALGDVVGAATARRRAPARGRARARAPLARRSIAGSGPATALAAQLGQLGAGRRGREPPDQRDRVALVREAEPSGPRRIRQAPDHADHRRREDRAGRRLVVQRDVAADDRHAERLAGLGQALHAPRPAARRRGASRGCRSSGSWSGRAARRPTQARLAAHS